MKMLFAGGKCENNCFANYGGCNAFNRPPQEEPTSAEIAFKIGEFTAQNEQIFLYTPDLFSDLYFDKVFRPLPTYMGGWPGCYIAVNAGIRSFIDRKIDLKELVDRNIQEIWFGVESGSYRVRDLYDKVKFTNQEVVAVTQSLNIMGIHACWYLLDSKEENAYSKADTFDLIHEASPWRIRIWNLG